MELWRKMGSLGYWGLLVDEKYGGSNLGALVPSYLQAAGRGGADQGPVLPGQVIWYCFVKYSDLGYGRTERSTCQGWQVNGWSHV